MENQIIIFTGPSLNHKEAKKILDADYCPPVGRDDILWALKDKPKVIGLLTVFSIRDQLYLTRNS